MRAKQDWSVGSTVKVGFLTLIVEAKVPTPGDYLPDAYVLSRGEEFYSFVPHNGLSKITRDRAKALVTVGKKIATARPSPVEVKVAEGDEAEGLIAQYFAGELEAA